MKRATAKAFQRTREKGTASMEALLCLPFLLLILALVLNVGYGWLVRLRADTAVRFAGVRYIHHLSDGMKPAAAEHAAEDDLRSFYYTGNAEFHLSTENSNPDLEGEIRGNGLALPGGWMLDKLRSLGASLSGRHWIRLTVPRRVPTRTLLPDTPVQVTFALDGNTWTYSEIPLSLKALTDLGDRQPLPIKVISKVIKGFFWMLGMEA